MTGPRRCGTAPGVAEHRRLRLPLFTSLRGYDAGWLRGDVIAGPTVWAVLVPEALTDASIAGLSPVVGLYAAPGALLLYAAFGSSRHLVVGPMSATAALSAAAAADVATPSTAGFVAHTAALAITTGLLALAAGLLRLGFLASFISEPVLKGFIIGLALTIIAGQLPDLFGVQGAAGTSSRSSGTCWPAWARPARPPGRRPGLAGPGAGAAPLRPDGARVAGGGAGRDRGRMAARPGRPRRRDRRGDPQRPAGAGPAGRGRGRLPEAGLGRRRGDAGRLRRGPGGGQDVRGRPPLRGRRQPGAARPRRGQPGRRPVQRHGGQRQPLQDGRQRVRRGQVAGLGAGRGRRHRPHPAVPDRPVRAPAQATLAAVVISAVIGFLDLAAMERVRRLRRDSFAISLLAMLAVLALGVLQGLIVAVVISLGVFLVRASRPAARCSGGSRARARMWPWSTPRRPGPSRDCSCTG